MHAAMTLEGLQGAPARAVALLTNAQSILVRLGNR